LSTAALFLGAVQLELGQPARAVGPLEKVVAAEPAHAEARRMLGDALLALERFDAARRHYRALVDAVPGNAAGWYGLGRSYEGLAAAAVQRLQRSAPDSAWLMLLAGEALVAQGRHANAFAAYRGALEKRPGLPLAHGALADIYEKTGHAEWAASERAKAAAAPRADCRAATLECEFRAGRHEAVLAGAARPAARTDEADYWTARAASELARAAFSQLDRLPPSIEAVLVRSDTLLAQGRPREAAEALAKALDSWPAEPRLRRALARARYAAGDFAGARALFELLLRADPDSTELAFWLGSTLLQQQDAAGAAVPLDKAVRADPKLLPARAALGAALAQTGKAAEAIPHLLAAAETDEDGSLHYQLAGAYQAIGEPERAAKALERSQQLRRRREEEQRETETEFRITPP
jgi:predicted Zn-dependent protease